MSRKKVIVYVYGTLRPGVCETVQVPGYLYKLGWYPGAVIKAPDCGSFFTAEKVEVYEDTLVDLDRYEGYRAEAPTRSLFIRKPYLDGWIYEYNMPVDHREIITDWLEHTGQSKGSAALPLTIEEVMEDMKADQEDEDIEEKAA